MSLQDLVIATALLRQQIANRPLLTFAVLFAVIAVLRRLRGSAVEPSKALPVLAAFAIGVYVTTVFWYVAQPTYADAAEPTIAAVATLFDAGLPVYHAPDAAQRYSHMYGPLAFILPAWWMSAAGFTIPASKGLGALAALLSLVVMLLLTGGRARRGSALRLTGLFCGLCLTFQHVSFWNRPDSLQVLLAGLAMLVVSRLPRAGATGLALGLITGVLADLKMTGPLYALPAFGVLHSRKRFGDLILGVLVASLVAMLPFIAFDNVSFANYVTWVRASANNGLVFWTLKQNVEWAAFLMLPVVAAFARPGRGMPDPWIVWPLTAAIVAVAVAAAKPGAGPYHLLPFLPAILYAIVPVVETPHVTDDVARRGGAWSFAITCVVLAALQLTYLTWATTRSPGARLVADLSAFVAARPAARIEMAYPAHNESYAYIRPILVFRQRGYLFDAPAIQEFQLSGLELPPASLQVIARCEIDAWLVARSGEPLTLRNRYPQTGYAPLFSAAARRTFHDAYARSGATEFFDVWTCRQPSR